MRKVVVLLLVCVFLGTLAACNNNGKMNSPTEANSVTVTNSTIDIGEKTPDGKYSRNEGELDKGSRQRCRSLWRHCKDAQFLC